jgi:hypothetical protein
MTTASHGRNAPMATLPFQKTSPRQTETGWLQSTDDGVLLIVASRLCSRTLEAGAKTDWPSSCPLFSQLPVSPRPSSSLLDPARKDSDSHSRGAGPGRGIVLIVLDQPGRSETCSWCLFGQRRILIVFEEYGLVLGIASATCKSFNLCLTKESHGMDQLRAEE